MSGKATQADVCDRFLEWCYTYRLNADLSREKGTGDDYVSFIRLRPWKQGTNIKLMFCGYGTTTEIAMRMAVKEYIEGEERVLDYGYRPWRNDFPGGVATSSPVEPPF